MLEKVEVNGPKIHPVYQFLKRASGVLDPIKWNFSKFLVSPDGSVVSLGLTSAAEVSTMLSQRIQPPPE